MYAPVTLDDRQDALRNLNNMKIFESESITNFILRFRRHIEMLSDVTISQPMPTDFELTSMFLHKCMQGTKEGTDLHNLIVHYRRKLKRATNPEDINFNLDQVETELCQLEATNPSVRYQPPYRRSFPRRFPSRRPNLPSPRPQNVHSANQTASRQPKSFCRIRCFFCGGPHALSQYTKCPPDQKNGLWDKHRSKFNPSHKPRNGTTSS